MLKNGMIAEDNFAGVVVYVIATKRDNRPDKNREDKPCVYDSVSEAEFVLGQMSEESRSKRTIRPATTEERKIAVLVHPKRKVIRGACLVELFEDLESRKFAISSKAENEFEFLSEFANAFSLLEDWEDRDVTAIRVREFGILMVDMCCKYRGYKADKVQSRMFLIAGDLEIPTLQVDAVLPQAFMRKQA